MTATARNFTVQEVYELADDYGGGVPPWLIVALANWESGLQNIPSSDGLGFGLLQVTVKFHPDVDLTDPATNIQVGAKILASNFFALNHIRARLADYTPVSQYSWHVAEYTKRAIGGFNAGAGNVEAWDERGFTYENWPVEATVREAAGVWDEFQKLRAQ